ncbi:MAG: flagellar biosynthetic protein FliO [Fibrobacteria bacterium]|nr:flagellar biosynthetic protein FliO [Fibrobacteria bacterium]
MLSVCHMLPVILLSVFFSVGGFAQQNSEFSDTDKKIISEKFERIRNEISEGKTVSKKIYNKKENKNKSSAEKTSLTKTAVQMVFGLAFIIVLIVVSMRLLKRFQKAAFLKSPVKNNSMLEVLETCYLGKDQKVIVMRMENTRTVVSATPNGIHILKELEGEVIVPATPLRKQGGNIKDFSSNLNSFLTQFKKPKTVTQSLEEL